VVINVKNRNRLNCNTADKVCVDSISLFFCYFLSLAYQLVIDQPKGILSQPRISHFDLLNAVVSCKTICPSRGVSCIMLTRI